MVELRISARDFRGLSDHLFPGDGDEHGAVLLCGVAEHSDGTRLLVREIVLAEDGVDYVRGNRGYRMLKESFVRLCIRRARDERLAYLAVHNHSGRGGVAFSTTDLRSHERGYPALLDIADGQYVGALVMNEQCVAGELWSPDRTRRDLSRTAVVGLTASIVLPSPETEISDSQEDLSRQVALFGDSGQRKLRESRVGIVGLGGVGMLLAHLLAGLRVGSYVLVDPDRVEPSNLPRLPGARRWDCFPRLASSRLKLIRLLAGVASNSKVRVARRVILSADPHARVTMVKGDVSRRDVVDSLRGCDYVFLAADSYRARNVVNALCHSLLIPFVQMGSKIESQSGRIGRIRSHVRQVTPDIGCLVCNGLVPPAKLQEETAIGDHAQGQRYVDDDSVFAPSVISLNARSASVAVDEFMLGTIGLLETSPEDASLRIETRRGRYRRQERRRSTGCRHCGAMGLRALGDAAALPVAAPLPRSKLQLRAHDTVNRFLGGISRWRSD